MRVKYEMVATTPTIYNFLDLFFSPVKSHNWKREEAKKRKRRKL
jgi:hypothetical protein